MNATLKGALVVLGLAAVVSFGACKKDEAKGSGSSAASSDNIPVAAVKEAKEIFSQRCVTCHGAAGKGDGAGAAALNPKPRDLTSKEWQGSVKDDHIEKIILQGGQAVGKSVAMPPNPDLDRKPMVIKALRAQVRALGQ